LRAADAEELRIILAGDAPAEQTFMHPNYIVNSPANRVVRKDQLIKMLSEGQTVSWVDCMAKRPSKDASRTSFSSKMAIGTC
jgi:hypothetical protein